MISDEQRLLICLSTLRWGTLPPTVVGSSSKRQWLGFRNYGCSKAERRTEREGRDRDPFSLAAGEFADALDSSLPGADPAVLVALARLHEKARKRGFRKGQRTLGKQVEHNSDDD